jgi:hypothetical protein
VNESQYQTLSKNCDQVLRGYGANICTIAIGWLHVLNEHPVNLSKYKSSFARSLFGGLLIRLRSAAFTLLKALKSKKTTKGWSTSSRVTGEIDFLLISHLLNENQLGVDNDFYFGALGEELQNIGKKCAILLINQTGKYDINIINRWEKKSVPRIMFDETISFLQEIQLRRELGAEARRLRKLKYKTPGAADIDICKQASYEAMSSLSISNLRFYSQMKSLVKDLRPKFVLATYEGHAWERMAFAAARTFNSDTLCIGYQHTILFPKQHAIKRTLGINFDPNIVIGAGNGSIKSLMDGCSLDSRVFKVYGTHRFNQDIITQQEMYSKKNPSTCLVIPDGIIEECILIFRFALQAAKLNKKIKFIFRMHPVLSFDQIIKSDNKFNNLPSNIELSNLSIEEDFRRARWALYRGSSAIIHAVMYGIRPFYIAMPEELSIDPIYKLNNWRIKVSRPQQLNSYIDSDLERSDIELLDESNEAIGYCREYFCKVDYKIFDDLLLN